MYARGMTVSEISGHLQEIYGVEVSGDFMGTSKNPNLPKQISIPEIFWFRIFE